MPISMSPLLPMTGYGRYCKISSQQRGKISECILGLKTDRYVGDYINPPPSHIFLTTIKPQSISSHITSCKLQYLTRTPEFIFFHSKHHHEDNSSRHYPRLRCSQHGYCKRRGWCIWPWNRILGYTHNPWIPKLAKIPEILRRVHARIHTPPLYCIYGNAVISTVSFLVES